MDLDTVLDMDVPSTADPSNIGHCILTTSERCNHFNPGRWWGQVEHGYSVQKWSECSVQYYSGLHQPVPATPPRLCILHSCQVSETSKTRAGQGGTSRTAGHPGSHPAQQRHLHQAR